MFLILVLKMLCNFTILRTFPLAEPALPTILSLSIVKSVIDQGLSEPSHQLNPFSGLSDRISLSIKLIGQLLKPSLIQITLLRSSPIF